MRKHADGFTLVELMVVVLIIGILVAVAVPVFNAAKADAERNVCFANQRTMEGVFQQYMASNPGAVLTFPNAAFFVTAGYLKKAPVCPSWVRDTTHNYNPAIPSHYYYVNTGTLEGTAMMHRPNLDGEYYWSIGCFTDIAGHGHYRNPGTTNPL